MEDRTWRRTIVALVLIGAGCAGWFLLGGWLFSVLTLVGLGLLISTWIVDGANDMYGPRSEYEVADDLVRADDQNEQGPHPGPLPPQGW